MRKTVAEKHEVKSNPTNTNYDYTGAFRQSKSLFDYVGQSLSRQYTFRTR